MQNDVKELSKQVTSTLAEEKKRRSTRNAWLCWGYCFLAFAWLVVPLWSAFLVRRHCPATALASAVPAPVPAPARLPRACSDMPAFARA